MTLANYKRFHAPSKHAGIVGAAVGGTSRRRYRHSGHSVIYFAEMRVLLQAYSLISRPVCAWRAARYRNGRKTAGKVPLPVLSVGNLALGGAGKTPLVCELIEYFFSRGYHPALVTRGYRGSWERRGGILSDGRTVFGGFREAGDEPAMVVRRFPGVGVFVGRHRLPSCLRAKSLGFDLCVLDDAFQHLGLARDLDIVLHDPKSHAALREGESALSRADILLLSGRSEPGTAETYRRRFPRLKVFECAVVPRGLVLEEGAPTVPLDVLRGKRVLAFAGIARPERFFTLLETLGASVIERLVFPDHFSYSPAACARISAAVSRVKPEMVLVTEKDAVKLTPANWKFGGLPVSVLRIGIELPSGFYDCVKAVVSSMKAGHV